MIFTDRTVIVQKGTSSINDTIILYRGDKGVEIRFTLNEGSPFRFGSGASPNIIEKTEAAYGQLIIKRPNDLPAVFSEIAPTNEGKIVFTITAEMIDEITEVGNYTFQIRLLDESRNSRATLPEVVNGIEIREPIATEDISDTNEVGIAAVGYALTTAGTTEDAFDSQGNYNKTTWGTGDRITAAKLDKIEAGIDGVNKKVASGGTGSSGANINDTTASATTTYSSNKIETIKENLSSRIGEIENYSLVKHTDGLLYIKKQDGTLLGTGVEVGNDADLSGLSITLSNQTLALMNGSTQLSSVTLPEATVTDSQVETAVRKFIDDGSIASLTIEDGSIGFEKLEHTDDKNLADKLSFTGGIYIDQDTGAETEGASFHYTTDYLELDANSRYVLFNSDFNYNNTYFFRGAYYNANKEYTEGIVSATQVKCDGNTKKYVRFTVDNRTIPTTNTSKFFFGKLEDAKVRIEQKKFHLAYVNKNYYTGGVTADALAENLVIPNKTKKEIVSNKNLTNSILYLNSNNLLNEQNLQLKTVLNEDGSIETTNSSTGVIDVEFIIPNTQYSLTVGGYQINTAWWLDEYKNPLQELTLSNDVSTYTSCEGAYYLRILTNYSNRPNTPTAGGLKVCEGPLLLEGEFKDEYKIKSEYLPGAKGNKDWSAYKYVAIGDSKTAGYSNNATDDSGNYIWDNDVATNYPSFISYYTGINLDNRAKTGAAFCTRTTVTDIPTMFEQAQNLPSDTDIVTVWGMANDRIIGYTNSNYNPENKRDNPENEFDTTTFKGAVRQTIKNIQLQCPNATIIFLVDEDSAEDGGQTKKDMIEEICKLHKIPTLNLTRCAMTGTACNAYVDKKYQNYTDGVHESVIGHKRMAKAVAGEMSKYLW